MTPPFVIFLVVVFLIVRAFTGSDRPERLVWAGLVLVLVLVFISLAEVIKPFI